jgi:4-hydroxy-tetrahydrodipicolinate synthase
MRDLKGINLAMQTPMHEDGSIDFSRWQELIDIYIDTGVHGIVLGAGTGQHPYLTQTECNKLYELGAARINGRCILICQTSALNVDEVIERSKHAQDLGADALMILPPYLEGPEDDDGLFEFYRSIDAVIDTDIIGYNIPQTTGIGISVELFKRLNELPHFNYIKDSAGDLAMHQAFLQTGCKVLNGADPITVFALMAGASGAIWGAANYMPHECVRLYELVTSGELNAAMALWSKMVPSLLYIWQGNYIAKVKAASKMRGFDGGAVRRPLMPLHTNQQNELASTLESLGQA